MMVIIGQIRAAAPIALATSKDSLEPRLSVFHFVVGMGFFVACFPGALMFAGVMYCLSPAIMHFLSVLESVIVCPIEPSRLILRNESEPRPSAPIPAEKFFKE